MFGYGRAYIDPEYYRLKLDSLLLSGYNRFEIQMQVLECFRVHFDVYFEEVIANE